MIRTIFAAAALLAAAPLAAQTVSQEQIDARYDRALAAGYKALFLCSAIANAERNGAARSAESIERWELTGIQAPLDAIVPALGYEIARFDDGELRQVSVIWAEDMRPRIAAHNSQMGCSLLPIGGVESPIVTRRPAKSGSSSPLVSVAKPLVHVFSRAMSGGYGEGSRTTAILVMRDGKIISEQYADDFGPNVPQRTWSVAKSIAATLVGAAVQRGETSVTARAGLEASAHSDARGAITVDHLLRMASGRYSDTAGSRTDPLYFGGSTVEETALNWPLVHAPGAVFRYANNDTLAAVKVIDVSLDKHPPAEFFTQLGMNHTIAEADWQGDYILSSQVWSTARDLARLGQLYLDDGVLADGKRILPEGWVDYVTAPSGPQPDGAFGYGASFWLLNKSEGVPSDTFAAFGNRGQFIIIAPKLNIVIVRRGEDPVGSNFDIAAFTREVLESLEK